MTAELEKKAKVKLEISRDYEQHLVNLPYDQAYRIQWGTYFTILTENGKLTEEEKTIIYKMHDRSKDALEYAMPRIMPRRTAPMYLSYQDINTYFGFHLREMYDMWRTEMDPALTEKFNQDHASEINLFGKEYSIGGLMRSSINRWVDNFNSVNNAFIAAHGRDNVNLRESFASIVKRYESQGVLSRLKAKFPGKK